eukprot:1119029-Alexandrium_andersonii.AAC.1
MATIWQHRARAVLGSLLSAQVRHLVINVAHVSIRTREGSSTSGHAPVLLRPSPAFACHMRPGHSGTMTCQHVQRSDDTPLPGLTQD